MNYTEHKNMSNKLESMLNKHFKDYNFSVVFSFNMDSRNLFMIPEYDFKLNILDNLKILEKGNKVLIGFEIPEVWSLQNIHCRPNETESDAVYRWFISGMRKYRTRFPSLYQDYVDLVGIDFLTGDYKDKVLSSTWYQDNVYKGIVERLMSSCSFTYRVRRVLGGLFTNPDNVCPMLQIDFDEDKLYIIRDGKFKDSGLSISKSSYSTMKKLFRINCSSFEGRTVGDTKGIEKIRVSS